MSALLMYKICPQITPTQHLSTMNTLNALLASAHHPYKSIFDNCLSILTIYLSDLAGYRGHYLRVRPRLSLLLSCDRRLTSNASRR
jgi:Golgin subfamily A member 7/ERF4 family